MLFIIIRRSHWHDKGGICVNVGDIFSDFNLFVVMVAADERQKKGLNVQFYAAEFTSERS